MSKKICPIELAFSRYIVLTPDQKLAFAAMTAGFQRGIGAVSGMSEPPKPRRGRPPGTPNKPKQVNGGVEIPAGLQFGEQA